MQEKLLETIRLDNGLKLRLFNCSRKISGGRWYVSVLARIDIPINDQTVDETEIDADLRDIKDLLGDVIVFEKNMERNFIDEKEKEEITKELIDSFKSGTSPYLSHEKFPLKYISKVYGEALKRKTWNR